MSAKFPRCPNCGSVKKSQVGQCKDCNGLMCNHCDYSGGIFHQVDV